ncbi:hypothetical protein LQZ18_11375, partial [Lachnospiraceae bacterium ZAX-1]
EGLTQNSIALAEQLTSIEWTSILGKIGKVTRSQWPNRKGGAAVDIYLRKNRKSNTQNSRGSDDSSTDSNRGI